MLFKKYFTPEEAVRTLPLVRGIVQDILEKGKALRAMLQEFEEQDLPKECYQLEADLKKHMSELEQIGCFFKDWNFEIGLVDFPAKINEEEVFLCWRSDEPELQWYHSVESGFASREPIPKHLISQPKKL